MARYRVEKNCTAPDGRFYSAGREIGYPGVPSRHFTPLDEEAVTAYKLAADSRRAARAVAKSKPAPLAHPDDPLPDARSARPAKGRAAAMVAATAPGDVVSQAGKKPPDEGDL